MLASDRVWATTDVIRCLREAETKRHHLFDEALAFSKPKKHKPREHTATRGYHRTTAGSDRARAVFTSLRL